MILVLYITIQKIQYHVYGQAYTDQARFWNETEYSIQGYRRHPVQGMEPDAASVRVKNRGVKQMIKVHEHREHQDQIR
jgi:hypothetical protein